MKVQEMINFLSITLSTTSISDNSNNPSTPTLSQNMPQRPVSTATQGYSSSPHGHFENQGQMSCNSYIVPWAQPHPQHQLQPPSQPRQQFQTQSQPQSQPQPQQQRNSQSQPQLQALFQPQLQSRYPQNSSGYPLTPWAATSSFASSQNHTGAIDNTFSTPHASSTASHAHTQVTRPLQHHNPFPSRGRNGSTTNGDPCMSLGSRNAAQPGVQKPFIPSYRLFEDLNVLGSADGRFKMTAGTSQSLSQTSGVIGRK